MVQYPEEGRSVGVWSGPFCPRTLVLAREARGLSQTELAKRAGTTQKKVSRLENGAQSPSNDLAERLAEAVGYPSSLFFQQDVDFRNLPITFFRKKKTIRQRTVKSIRARANFVRLHVRRLLSSVEWDPALPIPCVDLSERRATPEVIARELRLRWDVPPGPVENVTELLETAGVIIIPFDLETRKVDALSFSADDNPPVILVNPDLPGDRFRFTLVHELAHIILHHHLDLPPERCEPEADRFAAEFLMPAAEIRMQLMRVNLKVLERLKPQWGVSMAALIMQADNLGRLTDRQRQYLWKKMNWAGYLGPNGLEPVHVPRERPSTLPQLLRFHRDDLEYDVRQIAELLELHVNELQRDYYGEGPLRVV